MSDFAHALTAYPFLRQALLAGLLAAVASGVVGTYVVTRRITVIAGSLAHTVLGGMGAAYYLRTVHDLAWLQPLHGAVVAAVVAAVIIALVRTHWREREDTVISALWAVGMAVGVLFLFQTPGYKADLMTYLFGNLVLVDAGVLRLLAVLDVVVICGAVLFYHPLLAVCYDEEFARLRGINVTLVTLLMLLLTALAIVTLIYVVGVVMVIALVTLPVSVAGLLARRLWQMMILSAILNAVLVTAGLAVSYEADLPVGATTILLAAALYVVAQLAGAWHRRLKSNT
ncbi:metal ABC transporter permease [bacterium]|nr:metal ABC transporter permease [bacterium]